jgi:hypothetical protein
MNIIVVGYLVMNLIVVGLFGITVGRTVYIVLSLENSIQT